MSYNFDPNNVTYFASTDCRGEKKPFGIRALDRSRHMYVIGKTGMGKSTMLENMAIQDIQNGDGMCFIDPHGSTASKLLDYVPEDRIKDVVYFAPFDMDRPLGFNVMEDVGYDKRHLVVAGLMSAFQRIWVDAWSSRMEYILQNTLLALLEYPDTTLIDVNRMLINKAFRDKVSDAVSDPIVKRFWKEEFAGYTDRYTQEATPAIQNKIGQFTSNPLVRNIIGQSESTFDLRKIMDDRKIFIVNLSKGRMGEQNADLLGSILTTKIYLAAMSRAEETASAMASLPPFYLYVDEFQSVVNDSFANILSEARKYKLCLTIAHQYIEQIEENIRAAVFGNVGTTITFRVGPFDAETLKTVFEPTFYAEDLVNLGFAQIYLTLMIDGVGSAPFSAVTLPPVDEPAFSFKQDIIKHSQEKYGRPRADVERMLQPTDHTKKIEEKKSSTNKPFAQQRPTSKSGAKQANSKQQSGSYSNTKQSTNSQKRASTQQPKTEYKNKVTSQHSKSTSATPNSNVSNAPVAKDKSDLAEALGALKQSRVSSKTPADILRAKQKKKDTKQPQINKQEPQESSQSTQRPVQQQSTSIATKEEKQKSVEVSDITLRQILRDE